MIAVSALRIRHLVGLLLIPWASIKVSAFLGHQQPRASHVLFGENGEPNGLVQTVNGLSRTEESQLDGTFKLINNGYTGTEGYNHMLDSKSRIFPNLLGKRKSPSSLADQEENEDGWKDMRKIDRPMWKKLLRFPFKSSVRALFPKSTPEPGTLILVRHGESTWNANKTFTGWADPDLSERGRREVEHAARLLLEGGYDIDVVFTSRLKRAIRSVWIILQEMNQVYLPVFKSWRLNERMYGALTGLCKSDTAEQLGAELVQEWRGSLYSRPPALKQSDPHWPGRDRKYADLSADQIPLTESLSDSMARSLPLWNQKILFELRNGRNVLVVAHANTIRGLVKTIDSIPDDDIRDISIPTGIPIVYKFDQNMTPVPPSTGLQASQNKMQGLFLEKPGLLKEALKQEELWKKQVPGYNATFSRNKIPMTSLERSLYKLRAERELGKWAGQFIDPNAPVEDDGSDGNMGRPMQLVEDAIWDKGLNGADVSVLSDVEDDDERVKPFTNLISSNQPCVKSIPSASLIPGAGAVPIRQDAVVVIIRHGKTEHNKLGLFTGWEDAPLAKEGVEEAREAGRLLKVGVLEKSIPCIVQLHRLLTLLPSPFCFLFFPPPPRPTRFSGTAKSHGFEFDVVYTSWLSRAIETAWHVIDELDSLWLPLVKTWRLNERTLRLSRSAPRRVKNQCLTLCVVCNTF
jgi:2,3-bisphosphoglycerate-dependent phosphoglycerate mutase